MNFIQKFIDSAITSGISKKNNTSGQKRLSNENNINTYKVEENFEIKEENLKVKKENIKNQKPKTIETSQNKVILNENLQKELAYYLSNDTNLDNSLIKMNKTSQSNTTVINFSQETKSLKWILIQFVVGIVLIVFTLNYIKTQPAEEKFLNSSVQLWINTFQNLIGKFGGVFTQKVDDNYVQKRAQMINQLIDDETKVKLCLDKISDEAKRNNLQKLLVKIQTFRKFLSDTNALSLNNFIANYDQYNLYVYSLHKSVLQVCK